MLTEDQVQFIKDNPIVIFSTSSEANQPRAIFVEASKFEPDQIIMTDNYMQITKQNMLENPKVFVLAFNNNYKRMINIEGVATYEESDANFEFVKSSEQNKDYSPKGAVIIKITNVTESE